MDKRTITFSAFILLAIVQLYVPISMTLSSEKVLKNGKAFKFNAEPIDPTDPFRGKYITLRFQESRISVQDTNTWSRGEYIYLTLENTNEGFAKVASVSKQEPTNTEDFLRAKVRYNVSPVKGNLYNMINIEYPFERYYMEESKAYDAELAYRKISRDTTQQAYAMIKVNNGESVLEDFFIDDQPIIQYLKEFKK